MRADNLLLRPDGSAVLVDWPHAAVGAAVCDVVFLAPSVERDGGKPPEELLAAQGDVALRWLVQRTSWL